MPNWAKNRKDCDVSNRSLNDGRQANSFNQQRLVCEAVEVMLLLNDESCRTCEVVKVVVKRSGICDFLSGETVLKYFPFMDCEVNINELQFDVAEVI